MYAISRSLSFWTKGDTHIWRIDIGWFQQPNEFCRVWGLV